MYVVFLVGIIFFNCMDLQHERSCYAYCWVGDHGNASHLDVLGHLPDSSLLRTCSCEQSSKRIVLGFCWLVVRPLSMVLFSYSCNSCLLVFRIFVTSPIYPWFVRFPFSFHLVLFRDLAICSSITQSPSVVWLHRFFSTVVWSVVLSCTAFRRRLHFMQRSSLSLSSSFSCVIGFAEFWPFFRIFVIQRK